MIIVRAVTLIILMTLMSIIRAVTLIILMTLMSIVRAVIATSLSMRDVLLRGVEDSFLIF
jgi:hypothetical protein